jgi:uncharacterized protein YndB with AHSA1/START domain
MDPTMMPDLPMEAQITISRLFDAPRERVFAYLTEAEHLKEWWGPEGFTISEARSDPRAGGEFFLMMQGPDNMGGPVNGEYVEVVPPEVVAMTSWVLGEDGERILEAHERMTLTDVDGKTELVLEATGKALQPFAAAMLSGMRAGWNQSFQILDEVLRGVTDRQIVTMRMFEGVSAETVFDAFTDEEHIGEWFGPDGFTLTIHEMDVRPGGHWRFVMHGPDGTDYDNHVIYERVERPELLTYQHGGAGQDPFDVTVTFDGFMGSCVLTMRAVFVSAEERDRLIAEVGAMEGAEQTLGRLEAYLKG